MTTTIGPELFLIGHRHPWPHDAYTDCCVRNITCTGRTDLIHLIPSCVVTTP